MMKSNATKETGVAKNEGALGLEQDKVVVFLRTEIEWFDEQLTGHSEVNAQPVRSGKFEKHLFSPRFGTEKAGPRQVTPECARIRSAKDALPRMELHADDLLTQTGIPLLAKIFHFGQFGHCAV